MNKNLFYTTKKVKVSFTREREEGKEEGWLKNRSSILHTIELGKIQLIELMPLIFYNFPKEKKNSKNLTSTLRCNKKKKKRILKNPNISEVFNTNLEFPNGRVGKMCMNK